MKERAVLVPVWDKDEPYFIFSNIQKKNILAARLRPWRVVSDNKKEPVHEQASTCDSLLEVYPDAIVIGSPFGAVPQWWGGLAVAIGLAVSTYAGRVAIDNIHRDIFMTIVAGCASAIFFLVMAFFMRMAFFSPGDFPVLFNRKTRDIFYFCPERLPFFKFWRRVSFSSAKVEWGKLKVRSYKHAEFTSRTARDSYSLCIVVGEEGHEEKVKDVLSVGYQGEWEDERLFRLWEHIRRYMEEDGPAIQPGETLRAGGRGKLPKFPAEIVEAAGGSALSGEEVAVLSAKAKI